MSADIAYIRPYIPTISSEYALLKKTMNRNLIERVKKRISNIFKVLLGRLVSISYLAEKAEK
jgi:hypothetical protein